MRGAWLWSAGLALALTAGVALAQAQLKTHKMMTPQQMTWGKAAPGLPPSMEMTVLDGDPTKAGLFVLRARLPDGTEIRPHWHTNDEYITVLSGTMNMGMGDRWEPAKMTQLPPGGYFSLPGGQRHSAQARGETLIQISGPGPFDIFYVNPSDDPRNRRSSR